MPLRLSSRVAVEAPNELTVQRQAAVAGGAPVWDLTDSNPTRHGLTGPAVMEVLARHLDEAARYAPDPKGWGPAREALAARFGGVADDYWLTASTSEAYSWLFTILVDPGDAVGVPVPGYPLVEPLARLAGLTTVPYPSFYVHPHGWELDLDAARAVVPKVRAMVVVNPNNPTGAYVPSEASAALGEACAKAGIPLIADEVFYPFRLADPATSAQDDGSGQAPSPVRTTPLSHHPAPSEPSFSRHPAHCDFAQHRLREQSERESQDLLKRSSNTGQILRLRSATRRMTKEGRSAQHDGIAAAAASTGAVVITLDGLSKLLAAPQLKVGWLRLSGPPELTAPLADALDTVADTFLSVNSPAACALPELLTLADASVARITQRCSTNLAALQNLGDGFRVRHTEGGWTALVDVPRVMDDDALARRLLEHGLTAHPGWFYDVGDAGCIAVSLLPDPEAFEESLTVMAAALSR